VLRTSREETGQARFARVPDRLNWKVGCFVEAELAPRQSRGAGEAFIYE
jgi:hypothetical protein